MRLELDYPVTRAYPWRLTTLIVIVISLITFGALVYVNLSIVGVTPYTKYSPTFTEWSSRSWMNRLRIGAMANYTLGCDPATLVTGANYNTPNGAFTYTIQSLYDTSTSSPIPSANYNNSNLYGCKVDTLVISGDYSAYVASVETLIKCSLENDIELAATTTSIIRASWTNAWKEFDPWVTSLARDTSGLIGAFASDFFEDVLFSSRSGMNDNSLTGMFVVHRLHPNATIQWLSGSLSTAKILLGNPGPDAFRQYVSPSSVEAVENYIQILSGSILSDLGAGSPQNPLTSVEAFKSAIKPPDWAWRASGTPPFALGIVNGEMSGYNVPYQSIQPTQFSAQYLCHYVFWKPRTSLVIDVFVAISSLFMVFWGLLKVILTFFAKAKSESGNYCVCPNCSSMLCQADDGIKLVDVNDKSYERVPNPTG